MGTCGRRGFLARLAAAATALLGCGTLRGDRFRRANLPDTKAVKLNDELDRRRKLFGEEVRWERSYTPTWVSVVSDGSRQLHHVGVKVHGTSKNKRRLTDAVLTGIRKELLRPANVVLEGTGLAGSGAPSHARMVPLSANVNQDMFTSRVDWQFTVEVVA